MFVIPTQPLPNQQLQIQLTNQACVLNVYQNAYGLYADLYVNDVLTIGGVICLNRTRLAREPYLGFIGDLFFFDTQGETDPIYPGLGSRYQLIYVDPDEVEEG